MKDAVVEPMRTTVDRGWRKANKPGFPCPIKATDVAVFTAFDVTVTLPVGTPVLVGVKLTATVQLWPTFKEAETVGKFVPQVLVSPKEPVAAMFVIVTA